MKNQTYFLQKYLVLLVVVFLFLKVKAESYDSAFIASYTFTQQDSLSQNIFEKKYRIAEELFDNGNYSKSLELAYSLSEVEDYSIQIKVKFLLGKIFEKNNDLNTSLMYFKNSLSLLDNLENNLERNNYLKNYLYKIEAENLRYLGKLYGKINKIDSSLYYLNRLVKINSFDKNVLNSKAIGHNNLSIINFKDKDYKNAKLNLDKAIQIFDKANNKSELSMAYINLANIYEVTGKREQALKIYFKALSYVESKNDAKSLEYKEILYYNIAWTMYNLKDYKAYDYLERSYNIKDSLLDVNLRKELKKIEQTHNIDLIRKEEENKRFRLERSNWFMGITVALVSLLFLYLYNLNKLKRKDLSLKLSHQEFEQQKILNDLELESQAKILNATLDGKETERKQIAETLHDNVSALLSSAKMHLQVTQKHFGKNPPVELEKTQEIITEASQKIRDLSHTLVSSVLLKFGLEYALKDTAKKYSNSTIKIHTAISEIKRYNQEFEIKVFNIIQELINNILKHSKASAAFVAIEEENDKLLVIVKDNGIGFQRKKDEKTGIGLSQIEARVRIMDGFFNIDSAKGNGTKITLEIPIIKRKVVKLA